MSAIQVVGPLGLPVFGFPLVQLVFEISALYTPVDWELYLQTESWTRVDVNHLGQFRKIGPRVRPGLSSDKLCECKKQEALSVSSMRVIDSDWNVHHSGS